MSTLWNKASWVLVPSGIEEDIVFAQKPTSGLGDLQFTRASDGTRTNAQGVVERTPWNLFTQSVWTGGGANVAPTGWTRNFTTGNIEPLSAINGSVPYRFYGTAARSHLIQNVNLTSGQDFRLSVFVNSVTITTSIGSVIAQFGVSSINAKYYVDGVEVSSSANITANTRIAFSFTATSTGAGTFRIGGGVSANSTYDFVLSQPQVVEGTSALPYFMTTNRQDVPRLDYRNADGTLSSCPRLLVEPQRTNSIRNSSMVGAVAGSPGTLPTNWTVSAAAGLTQTVVGIGTENGLPYIDLRFNGTASASALRFVSETTSGIAALPNQIWSNSSYFKLVAGVLPYITLRNIYRNSGGGAISTPQQQFDLTATLTRRTFTDAAAPALTAFVQQEVLATLVIGQTFDFTIRIAAPQMELGAYATTWIPTTTAAVTRLADVASKTGVSSLIGQTEGTLFVDIEAKNFTSLARIFAVSNGNTVNRVILLFPTSTQIRATVTAGAVQQFQTNANTSGAGRYKMALAYKNNDFAFYVNGTLIGSQLSGTVPACSNVYLGTFESGIGDNILSEGVNQAALFTTRLTNAELAALTTL